MIWWNIYFQIITILHPVNPSAYIFLSVNLLSNKIFQPFIKTISTKKTNFFHSLIFYWIDKKLEKSFINFRFGPSFWSKWILGWCCKFDMPNFFFFFNICSIRAYFSFEIRYKLVFRRVYFCNLWLVWVSR